MTIKVREKKIIGNIEANFGYLARFFYLLTVQSYSPSAPLMLKVIPAEFMVAAFVPVRTVTLAVPTPLFHSSKKKRRVALSFMTIFVLSMY